VAGGMQLCEACVALQCAAEVQHFLGTTTNSLCQKLRCRSREAGGALKM
jgi:hypothetical protein